SPRSSANWPTPRSMWLPSMPCASTVATAHCAGSLPGTERKPRNSWVLLEGWPEAARVSFSKLGKIRSRGNLVLETTDSGAALPPHHTTRQERPKKKLNPEQWFISQQNTQTRSPHSLNKKGRKKEPLGM